MTAPGRLIITLRSSRPGAETLPGNLVGNSLTIAAEVRDEHGALVDAQGATMLFRRPGLAVPLRVPADSLIRDGVGRYRASILPDVGGTWRARFEVSGPVDAAEEIRFVVPASAVVTPTQPQPVLADEAGAPLLSDDGGPITVHRATTRPHVSTLDPDFRVMGFVDGAFVQTNVQVLRDDAAAAAGEVLVNKADIQAVAELENDLIDTRAVTSGLSNRVGALESALPGLPPPALTAVAIAKALGLPLHDFSDPRNSALLTF